VLGVAFASLGLLITLWAWLGQDFDLPNDANPTNTAPSPTSGAITVAPSPAPTASRTASLTPPPVQRIEIVIVPGTPNEANVSRASSGDAEPDWASRVAGILTSLGTLLVGVASVAALRKARSAEQAASAATAASAAAQRDRDRMA
jgi:hypothetical protein